MEIDDNSLFEFMQDVRRDLGRLVEASDNQEKHTAAVSAKASAIRAELQNHIQDDDAHGLGASRKNAGMLFTLAGILISVASLAFAFLRK